MIRFYNRIGFRVVKDNIMVLKKKMVDIYFGPTCHFYPVKPWLNSDKELIQLTTVS